MCTAAVPHGDWPWISGIPNPYRRRYIWKRRLNQGRKTRRGGFPLDDSLTKPKTFFKLSPLFQLQVCECVRERQTQHTRQILQQRSVILWRVCRYCSLATQPIAVGQPVSRLIGRSAGAIAGLVDHPASTLPLGVLGAVHGRTRDNVLHVARGCKTLEGTGDTARLAVLCPG